MHDPLVEELKNPIDRRKVEDCRACRVIDALPEGDRKEAVQAALSGTIGTRTLSLTLRRHGMTVSRESITKHRKEGHRP
jgi:hypothetical protein